MVRGIDSRAFLPALAALLLTACAAPATSPVGPYARFLKGDETVRKVSQEGPFTLLDIDYRACCGFFNGAQLFYQRILYRDKVVVKRVERAEPFAGFGRPALAWPVVGSDGDLAVLSDANGKPVFDKFNPGAYGYRAQDGSGRGHLIAPGVRYFPGSRGALVRGFPITVQALPQGIDCCGLSIDVYAGTSPDGSAFAFTDRHDAPGAIVVVDADGQAREPIAFPHAQPSPDSQNDLSRYSPLLRWFETSFDWKKDGQGHWNVAPVVPRPAAARNPVEEFFLDSVNGYRQCVATDNASCLKGWRPLRAGELPGLFKDGYVPPHAYGPADPTQAFGAPVNALFFGQTMSGGPGYHLLVAASPAQLVSAFEQRLRQRKLPFVRIDECPRKPLEPPLCVDTFRRDLGWKSKPERGLADALRWHEQDGAMFMLPTITISIAAVEGGMTQIATAARYPLPPSESR